MAANARQPLDLEGLWQYALRSLAGRSLSAAELRERLRARAARADDVPAILARLKEYGYVSDRKLAESYAASRLENQGLGKTRVLHDLRKRRVAPAVAQKAVAAAYEGTDEVALIEAYLARKYRNRQPETFFADPKNVASAYRRLRTAGFSAGNAIRVLKRYAKEAEILESLEGSEDCEDA